MKAVDDFRLGATGLRGACLSAQPRSASLLGPYACSSGGAASVLRVVTVA